ncbi:MAG: RNA polymerase sigma factor [Candidatus Kerfeldbacteria bacterium]|nr:RNA polymerase sigma factor [Candidatus Kerfeldbacteria bacterium]
MEISEHEIQKIVRAAQSGDRDSMGQLFDLFNDRIYRFVAYRVSTRETAEDLTQTIFVATIESLHRYMNDGRTKFSTWLFQIARHKLIDHYRQQRVQIPLDHVSEINHATLIVESPELAFDSRSTAVWRMFKQLPLQFQEVLQLHYVEGIGLSDIAQIIGTSAVNARVIKYRALRQLRRLLNESSATSL